MLLERSFYLTDGNDVSLFNDYICRRKPHYDWKDGRSLCSKQHGCWLNSTTDSLGPSLNCSLIALFVSFSLNCSITDHSYVCTLLDYLKDTHILSLLAYSVHNSLVRPVARSLVILVVVTHERTFFFAHSFTHSLSQSHAFLWNRPTD